MSRVSFTYKYSLILAANKYPRFLSYMEAFTYLYLNEIPEFFVVINYILVLVAMAGKDIIYEVIGISNIKGVLVIPPFN